jgi:hypothetical protein
MYAIISRVRGAPRPDVAEPRFYLHGATSKGQKGNLPVITDRAAPRALRRSLIDCHRPIAYVRAHA